MQYLQDIGCETVSKEYKVFTFNDIDINTNNAIDLLKSGKWEFDNLTIKTLKYSINKIIPKYLASYSNPNSKCNGGILYIGIDDDGIVHGIPSTNDISIEFIKKQINKSIIKNVRSVNNNSINDYMDKIQFEIIKLDKSEYLSKYSDLNYDSPKSSDTLSDLEEIDGDTISSDDIFYNIIQFNKLITKIEKYDKLKKDYIRRKRKVEHLLSIYTSKLNEIINDKKIRNEIIEYIQNETFSNKKIIHEKYKDIYPYCEIKNDYWNLIEELRSSKTYDRINYEEANILKEDKTNIFYWIMKWKDSKINIIKSLKPQKIGYSINYKTYSMFLLSQVTKMIPSWIKNNTNLNLYVLKISLPTNINKLNYLEYKNKNEWIKSYRTDHKGEPCCKRI